MIKFDKFEKFASLLTMLKEQEHFFVVYGSQKKVTNINSPMMKFTYVALTPIGTLFYQELVNQKNTSRLEDINTFLETLNVNKADISAADDCSYLAVR